MASSRGAFAGGKEVVVLDSCVVINLFATRIMSEIVASIEVAVTITKYTLAVEALWVGAGRCSDPSSDVEAVDLRPLVDNEILQVLEPTPGEADKVVELAADIDDGEAIAGAIAFGRGFAIATDDTKARSVFHSLAPPLSLVSTPEILKRWSSNTGASPAALREALRDIHQRARFHPAPADPLHSWWRSSAA
jgi:hypothetical protein